MSRIGKQPIEIPAGVKVAMEGGTVKVTGPLGNLALPIRDEISVLMESPGRVNVGKKTETKVAREIHGLTRTLIANMVKGVAEGFEKKLETVGVGYRAEVKGDGLTLSLGYSQPINYPLPKTVKATVDKQTSITLKSVDKQLLGQVAAEIRALRPPEPYKGKGVKYAEEVIRRKAGKAGKGGAGAAGGK